MTRQLVLIIIEYFLVQSCFSQKFDLSVCPNGLTSGSSAEEWPKIFPNRFQLITEISTDIQTFELTQYFHGPDQDVIRFQESQSKSETYWNFQTNEMIIIDANNQCNHVEINFYETFAFVAVGIIKPSILFGFDGRNNRRQNFVVQFLRNTTVRGGIPSKQYQSCFYLEAQNLTVNATYYMVDSNRLDQFDFVQIDVHSNYFPYTYNIIRFRNDPLFVWTSPSGVFCPNRTNIKELPNNVPSKFSYFSETFNLKTKNTRARIESSSRLIDRTIAIERNDYNSGKKTSAFVSVPSAALIDYATSLSFLYTDSTEQCTVMNITRPVMPTSNQILLHLREDDDVIGLHYTGIVDCDRAFVKCHRWIAQRDFPTFIQQYEWYWSAQFHQIDLDQSVPIQLVMERFNKFVPDAGFKQEINFYNYNPTTSSLESIDSTLGLCYRALGPSHHFDYAVLRFTLDNDARFPVYRYTSSLQNSVHLQLANDLRIRHIRLSSFTVDTSRDMMKGEDRNVYVTFTLLDSPPAPTNSLNEDSMFSLIQQLADLINEGLFHVRDDFGAYQLQARPRSLQTLVLFSLSYENQNNQPNQTVFVYQNFTRTITKRTEKLVEKNSGPQIAALWTGFALLGLVVALAIGIFVAVKKWTPIIHRS